MYEDISWKIDGWFSNIDKVFYNLMFDKVPNGGIIIEIGSFKGRSSAYMTHLIANSEKTISFFCVDTWEGSPEHQEGQPFADNDVIKKTLFEVFKENMKNFSPFYIPIRATSVEAAKKFKDNSLDFVFIDADHSYESVVEDIITWLPKVKKGGWIGGHDYPFESVMKAVKDTIGYIDVTRGGCWGKKVV